MTPYEKRLELATDAVTQAAAVRWKSRLMPREIAEFIAEQVLHAIDTIPEKLR